MNPIAVGRFSGPTRRHRTAVLSAVDDAVPAIARLIGPPQADGEYIALPTKVADEEIVHLRDYERIYRAPRLYEHVVQDLLRCRSPHTAADRDRG